MGVELRKGRNGKLRPFWYGKYEINGKRYCTNLGVAVRGTPPDTLRSLGDIVFERSRAKAQEALASIVNEATTKRHSDRILEKIYEHKTGESVPSVPINDILDMWLAIPRSKPLSNKYISHCSTTIRRFYTFVQQTDHTIRDMTDINHRTLQEFLRAEESRGISAKTYNDILKLLRTIWNKLLPGFPNPLNKFITKEPDTQFRKPFSEDELHRIITAVRSDTFICPIIITGICTAMRRGDCCLLKSEY